MSALRKTRTINLRIEPEAHDLIARAAEVSGKKRQRVHDRGVCSLRAGRIAGPALHRRAATLDAVSEILAAPGVARAELVQPVRDQARVDRLTWPTVGRRRSRSSTLLTASNLAGHRSTFG